MVQWVRKVVGKVWHRSFGSAKGLLNSEQPSTGETDFSWDEPCDTRYAWEIAGFDRVLHVFQQEWVGVRAAAGSLPGRKLALRHATALAPTSLEQLMRAIADLAPQRIVIHGMSDAMAGLIEAMAAQGWQERIFVVLHGATSQWFSEPEARYAFKCIEFARSARIHRLHVMKSGFDFPCGRLYRPMLFNLSPRIGDPDAITGDGGPVESRVLIPGWTGWRKNIHTNALGAALSARVQEIWAFGHDLVLPPPLDGKIRIVPFQGREQTFELIKSSAMVMNVSLVDCHPMVHLEAQVLGRACLRGPLFLDALEDHPYIRLTCVADVSSPVEIRDALERVLDVPAPERSLLARDYQAQSDRIAVQRYREFLEL